MLIIDFARVFETCIFLRVFAPGSHQGANPKNKKHGYLHFVRSFSEISIRVATQIDAFRLYRKTTVKHKRKF